MIFRSHESWYNQLSSLFCITSVVASRVNTNHTLQYRTVRYGTSASKRLQSSSITNLDQLQLRYGTVQNK